MARPTSTIMSRLNRLATGGSALPSKRAAPQTGGRQPAVEYNYTRSTGGNSPASRRTVQTGGPAPTAKRGAPPVSPQLPPRPRTTMQTGGGNPAIPTAGARSGVGRLQQFEHLGIRDKRTRK